MFTLLLSDELHERGSGWMCVVPVLEWGRYWGTEGSVVGPWRPPVPGRCGEENRSSTALASCCHKVALLKLAPAQPLLTHTVLSFANASIPGSLRFQSPTHPFSATDYHDLSLTDLPNFLRTKTPDFKVTSRHEIHTKVREIQTQL